MSDNPQAEFEQVRKAIDNVDSELVDLIAKRLALTSQVGSLKAELSLPLYVPSRETELINNKRQLARQKGISADLVEDVIRRIMRDSYLSQNKTRSQVCQQQTKKIVIIGGRGQLGGLFVKLFQQSGYPVDVIEKEDWGKSEEMLLQASLVMVAVPIRVTISVIEKLSTLSRQCLLVDITSVKQAPLESMLKHHRGPVLGLHPMFGPGIEHLAKQMIAVCYGRKKALSQWFIEQLQTWGASLSFIESKEHDYLMSIVQVLRHFSSIAYGYHLKQEQIDLKKILQISSPIYRLELIMVGRLFAQDAKLYSDIIFSDKKNIPMVKRFINRLEWLLKMLETEDKEQFSKLFGEISRWFGENAEHFLRESNLMLAKANDIRQPCPQETNVKGE